MVVFGGYLLLARVTVGSGGWMLWDYSAFGLSLLAGIGWLFFDGRSAVGWLLAGAGALIILAGIIADLHIYFGPASLFDTLVCSACRRPGWCRTIWRTR